MKTFNEENFTELLTNCNDNAEYRGAIVLSDVREVRHFMSEIAEVHRANPISGVKAIRTSLNIYSTTPRILFDNNSLIDIMVAGESRRGLRYNNILCSTPIRPDILNVVQGWEIDYRSTWHREYSCEWEQSEADPMDNITDTAELDKFLNRFIVNS